MRRELYHWLNIAILIAMALIICGLQTVILKLPAFRWMGIDLLLLLVTYLGLRRGLFEGALVTGVIAHIAELHSGSPAGFAMSCYFVVFGATVLTREFFLMESPFSIVILGVFSGLAWKIALLILAYKADTIGNLWKTVLIFLPPYLIAQGLLIRPFFGLLQRLDSATGVGEQSEFHGAY